MLLVSYVFSTHFGVCIYRFSSKYVDGITGELVERNAIQETGITQLKGLFSWDAASDAQNRTMLSYCLSIES